LWLSILPHFDFTVRTIQALHSSTIFIDIVNNIGIRVTNFTSAMSQGQYLGGNPLCQPVRSRPISDGRGKLW
jgi:hypothetical protein